MLFVLRLACLVFRMSSFVCHVPWDTSVFSFLVSGCLVSVSSSCMRVIWVVVRFSHCSLFGVCFWCFRFARCGASGHVGASALSLCCVLACVSLLLLPRLGKRVVICTFLERVVNIFLRFPFCSRVFSEWLYSTSRPGGNQVDGFPPALSFDVSDQVVRSTLL